MKSQDDTQDRYKDKEKRSLAERKGGSGSHHGLLLEAVREGHILLRPDLS